jgi:hypothetical protein
MRGRWARLLAMLTLSILVRYDTMEILVYIDPGPQTKTIAEAFADVCGVARAMDLALPTPYRIQWRKELPNGAILPDESRTISGMLTAASCSQT